MSPFRNPVGPQSSKVYWRRRLLVLLGLVVVIVVIALVVGRLASGDPGAGTAAPSSETADDETVDDDTVTDDAAAEVPPAEELIEGADCLPESIRLEAITDKVSYAAGELPQLSFSITNTGGASCLFNAGTTQQTYEVTSGEELYWSSKDCETEPVDAEILLEPNLTQTPSPIQWDRTRSALTTCEGDRPAVPAGGATYSLNVTVGAVEATAPKSFLLN